MRIFIGYGYNARDKWVEDYVFPLVKAYGCTVNHGKAVYGGGLTDEVFKLIRTSDEMIGMTTRRDPTGTNAAGEAQFTTHPWARDELTAALSQSIPFVEVREEGVMSLGGAIDAANTQRIDYREADRAACLVGIAEALTRFHVQTIVTTVKLGPELIADEINPLDDPTFFCRCQTLRGANESC